jgi:hypothetical protein
MVICFKRTIQQTKIVEYEYWLPKVEATCLGITEKLQNFFELEGFEVRASVRSEIWQIVIFRSNSPNPKYPQSVEEQMEYLVNNIPLPPQEFPPVLLRVTLPYDIKQMIYEIGNQLYYGFVPRYGTGN